MLTHEPMFAKTLMLLAFRPAARALILGRSQYSTDSFNIPRSHRAAAAAAVPGLSASALNPTTSGTAAVTDDIANTLAPAAAKPRVKKTNAARMGVGRVKATGSRHQRYVLGEGARSGLPAGCTSVLPGLFTVLGIETSCDDTVRGPSQIMQAW